jgi:hypothetical protein
MKSVTHIAGYRIVDGRYALLERLAQSSTGIVYRARDLTQAQEQGMDSRILVHELPTTSTSHTPIKQLYQQLEQQYGKIRDTDWILAPRHYVEEAGTSFIILECPAKHAVSTLQDHLPGYAQTQKKLWRLHKSGHLGKHIDPTLLVCTSQPQIYLLASALPPEIQALQTSLATISGKRPYSPLLLAGAGLSIFTTLGMAASACLRTAQTSITR